MEKIFLLCAVKDENNSPLCLAFFFFFFLTNGLIGLNVSEVNAFCTVFKMQHPGKHYLYKCIYQRECKSERLPSGRLAYHPRER